MKKLDEDHFQWQMLLQDQLTQIRYLGLTREEMEMYLAIQLMPDMDTFDFDEYMTEQQKYTQRLKRTIRGINKSESPSAEDILDGIRANHAMGENMGNAETQSIYAKLKAAKSDHPGLDD